MYVTVHFKWKKRYAERSKVMHKSINEWWKTPFRIRFSKWVNKNWLHSQTLKKDFTLIWNYWNYQISSLHKSQISYFYPQCVAWNLNPECSLIANYNMRKTFFFFLLFWCLFDSTIDAPKEKVGQTRIHPYISSIFI